ncbi:MAG: site-specific integrase, partial [Clostridium sp.]
MSTLVFRELNDIDIIIEESVEFNVLNKNRYFELFNNKVLSGNIRKDISFFDDRWVMIVGGIEKVIMLPSEVEMKRL